MEEHPKSWLGNVIDTVFGSGFWIIRWGEIVCFAIERDNSKADFGGDDPFEIIAIACDEGSETMGPREEKLAS